ncbi:MAG: HPr kinase/phosphatase C-terminal domain-containing protein [Pseudolabrys sp.]|jgi:HPr kinase/phosphorylase
MAAEAATIHASAVLVGRKAVLIRGAPGAGKSNLAWHLVQAGSTGALPFARLIADDRAYVEVRGGRLLVRPHASLAGLIEIRGVGIRRLAYEPLAVAGFVIDLSAGDAERYPSETAQQAEIDRVILPRLAVAAGVAPLPAALAFLTTAAAGN